MKKVTLKTLTLENWRAQNRTIDFSDRTVIRGANGAGKSTITDAFLWLLTGVDSEDRSNYDLYDNTKEFTPENAIPAIVEGVFDVDGVEFTYKRSAKQKWIRPRGKSEYVKDKSDDYAYYIDGLAVSATVYKESIEDMYADIDKLKLMLNVRYYRKLDWKALRKHFADMVGLITDSELKGDYSSISELLATYGSTDRAKEKLRQDINPLKKANDNLESEIKGMKAMLPTLDGVEEAIKERDAKNSRIAEIEKEILGLGEVNKPFVEKRKAELAVIEQKQRELDEACRKWNEAQNVPVTEIRKRLLNLQEENSRIAIANTEAKRHHDDIKTQIEAAKSQYDYFDKERTRLKSEKEDIMAQVFDENQLCPTCGQQLPYDKVADLKAKFYEKRDAKVAQIIERGKKVRAMRDEQEALRIKLEGQLTDVDPQPLLDETTLREELASAENNKVPFDDSVFVAEIERLRNSLTVVPEVNSDDLIAEKKKLNDEIVELSSIITRRFERERGEKKILEKEKELSETGIELAKLEGLFDKCVEREREWAAIVRDRANKYLHQCHVEMTELSKSGEINDICTISIDGVDVGVANTARQIVAGIDIAEAFQLNSELNLPLFIDNAEQICDSNIPVVSNQMVLTYVDSQYPELYIH